jgi:ArsR family transcriptional regulator
MYQTEASLFKVLSDPTRIRLLQLLIEGESCGCTLIDKVDVSQPTLSYHLNLIAKHGLATKVQDGTKQKYFVNKDKVEELQAFLQSILGAKKSSCEVGK